MQPIDSAGFDKSRETHIVADASETGIQVSLYQVTTLENGEAQHGYQSTT